MHAAKSIKRMRSWVEALEARQLLSAPTLTFSDSTWSSVTLSYTADAGASVTMEMKSESDPNFHTVGASFNPIEHTCTVADLKPESSYEFRLRSELYGELEYGDDCGTTEAWDFIPFGDLSLTPPSLTSGERWATQGPYPQMLPTAVAPEDPEATYVCSVRWEERPDFVGGPYWDSPESMNWGMPHPYGGAVDHLCSIRAYSEVFDPFTFEMHTSNWSEMIQGSATGTATDIPEDLTFTRTADGGADISWSAVSGLPGAPVVSYRLMGGDYHELSLETYATNTSVHLSAGELPTGSWTFGVFALGGPGGMSLLSETTSANIVQLPASPGGLHSTLIAKDKVNLIWSNSSRDEDGFRIQMREEGAGSWTDVATNAADVTSKEITLPEDYVGKLYEFRVCAYNDRGDSGYVTTTASGVALQGVGFTGIRKHEGSQVGFSIQSITRDAAQTYYMWPEWWDENCDGTIDGESGAYSNHTIDGQAEHRYPVSYLRTNADADSFMSLRGWLQYEMPLSEGWLIRAAGGGCNFSLTAVVGDNDQMVVLDTTTRIASTIDSSYPTFTWEMSTNNGASWFGLGANSNQIYVTGAPAGEAFETVLDIGCRGANGLIPAEPGELEPGATAANRMVAEAIWEEFSDLHVQRVDGVELKYSHDPGKAMNAAGILAHPQGRGQCTAWVDLMTKVMAVHGITAAGVEVLPKPEVNAHAFELYDSPAQGSVGDYPLRKFETHWVVQLQCNPSAIYDPSYGTATDMGSWSQSTSAWECLFVMQFIRYQIVGEQLVETPIENTADDQLNWRTPLW